MHSNLRIECHAVVYLEVEMAPVFTASLMGCVE